VSYAIVWKRFTECQKGAFESRDRGWNQSQGEIKNVQFAACVRNLWSTYASAANLSRVTGWVGEKNGPKCSPTHLVSKRMLDLIHGIK
jgi:hypothetical protein